MQGRLRVNKVRGSGGVKARELRVWNKDIVMSSTKSQRTNV
jgi:hypothetical protein